MENTNDVGQSTDLLETEDEHVNRDGYTLTNTSKRCVVTNAKT